MVVEELSLIQRVFLLVDDVESSFHIVVSLLSEVENSSAEVVHIGLYDVYVLVGSPVPVCEVGKCSCDYCVCDGFGACLCKLCGRSCADCVLYQSGSSSEASCLSFGSWGGVVGLLEDFLDLGDGCVVVFCGGFD